MAATARGILRWGTTLRRGSTTSAESGQRRAPAPPYLRIGRWSLAAAMAGSALAIGTVHTVTLCVVSAVLAVAAAAVWWRSEPIRVRPPATLLLCTGAILVGYTVLQAVPLPIGVLRAIAPQTADIWSRALAPLHEAGPRWAPLTLDPPATHVEVLRGVAYLLAFLAALRIAHRREGVAFLSAVIVGTALALALAALLHPAFGAKKLYGIYDPGPGVAESHIAPLLNPNNLAGYINVAFCLTLATSLSPEPRVPRAIALAVAALLAAAQVWVASRGGVIAMVLGGVAVGALALGERARRSDPRAWLTAACGAATVIGGIFIVLGSSEKAKGELSSDDVTKFVALLDVAKMLPAYGVFGVGRGAFESAFARFHEAPGYLVATNPENIVAQWVSEWGIPVGVAALVAITVALRPTAALARSRSASGAWAALAAIAVQNMADFSSEIPGVMISVAVCGAIVVAGSAGLSPRWRVERWSRHPGDVGRVSAIAGAAAIVLAVTAVGHHVHDDRKRLHEAALSPAVSVAEMHALAREAMRRHPAEPYLPFAAALRAVRARDESPVPWLGAALERAKVYGPAHILLARVLAPRSPAQARLEYRLALEQAPEALGAVKDEAARLVRGFDDAMELVPPGEAGDIMLYWLTQSLAARLPATCERLRQEWAARDRASPGPLHSAAVDALADVEGAEPASWCEDDHRPPCIDRALQLARRLEAAEPLACEGYALEARALTAGGQAGQAIQRLERIADQVRDRVVCLEALARLARAVHDESHFENALNEIMRAGCSSEEECQANLRWVAEAQAEDGSPRRALATYKRIYERAPADDGPLERMAQLAERAGLNAEALRDYEELERRHPGDGRWARAVEEQREAMLKRPVTF